MLRKQRGMTFVSWVVIGAFVGALLLGVLKILPSYMNYASVKSIMNELPRDDKIKGQNAQGIRKMISSRLMVNDLSAIAREKGAFKLKKIDNGFKITLKYEERKNLFANLDYVVVFDHEVDVNVKE